MSTPGNALPTPPIDAVKQRASSLRVIFLTNMIPPYQKPVLERLAQSCGCFRVLLSTRLESNRQWELDWSGLDVVVQRTLTLNRRWSHPQGFTEPLFVHLPVDTLPQLHRFAPDVIVSWEMGVRTILAALYRLLNRRSRLLVWAEFSESTEYGRGKFRQVLRKLLHPFIDGFLVTGHSGARYLRSLGVSDHKLHRIFYTTNVDRFAALKISHDRHHARRLLYVGQLIDRKGLLPFLQVLIDWARLHADQSIEWHLAGEGPLRRDLEHQPAPPNLKLIFLGNVSYADLPAVYGAADVFVFPTLADTWGVVVNEAMAAGLPVLGSTLGQAVQELVEDGKTGWTFRTDRLPTLSHALARCLQTPQHELSEMGLTAQQSALALTPQRLSDLILASLVEVSQHH